MVVRFLFQGPNRGGKSGLLDKDRRHTQNKYEIRCKGVQ